MIYQSQSLTRYAHLGLQKSIFRFCGIRVIETDLTQPPIVIWRSLRAYAACCFLMKIGSVLQVFVCGSSWINDLVAWTLQLCVGFVVAIEPEFGFEGGSLVPGL